ncbi:MAG: hydantoinase B/oxoprolinase family protein [Candidatus Binatia bacterium]|nr:hydantoinase B/oxoprolinase family protein [Candidatus Binatia bacterium]
MASEHAGIATKIDAIAVEVYRHRLAAIAEEMGLVLRRAAFSPNIKERRDYSCAVFDAQGALTAQAAHIPVHLGSMQLAVNAALEQCKLAPGDVVILNDPFSGGTHLPDVTLVAPVYVEERPTAVAFVAARAHHSDIGGSFPGSMGLAEEIYQEGLRLPPVHLVRAGERCDDVFTLFAANTRAAQERRGDLLAQLAALRVGSRRITELIATVGERRLAAAMSALQAYSERLLRVLIQRLPDGVYRARDHLDDDGMDKTKIPIAVAVTVDGEDITFDFSGSAAQVQGGVNANLAITWAAVLYCLQLLARGAIPANAGFARPVRVVAPEGSIVNARFPAAVAGGNVETSQRIVDAILRALAQAAPEVVPAASCGSMNNLALGGSFSTDGDRFTYYETVAGGAGGGPQRAGASGVHTHMTNTWNTPIEALETHFPVRVTRYSLRKASGGAGLHPGGCGVVREIEALVRLRASLLTERRRYAPWGLRGGRPGRPGRNWLIRTGHGGALRKQRLPSKVTVTLEPNDRLRLETPGGGGWGGRKGARGR